MCFPHHLYNHFNLRNWKKSKRKTCPCIPNTTKPHITEQISKLSMWSCINCSRSIFIFDMPVSIGQSLLKTANYQSLPTKFDHGGSKQFYIWVKHDSHYQHAALHFPHKAVAQTQSVQPRIAKDRVSNINPLTENLLFWFINIISPNVKII